MKIDRSAVMFGVVFVALGVAYLLDDLGMWTVQVTYLWPVLLIVAGLALAATAIGGDRR
ncbi:MAG TPA: DUF5668 domain-containing protein [Egibacteraceae bacterium]|nr:DUF5668 domain-containing protein [Egibacteraceae bacterium]